ncbi:hypothetical protein K440DRAFT_643888 [Wilcoxina mikolae CBS 423.85]|nr:hypothetical protein K440DRAFT_643888 [Wilcoxina mikolae CBS 423.85]
MVSGLGWGWTHGYRMIASSKKNLYDQSRGLFSRQRCLPPAPSPNGQTAFGTSATQFLLSIIYANFSGFLNLIPQFLINLSQLPLVGDSTTIQLSRRRNVSELNRGTGETRSGLNDQAFIPPMYTREEEVGVQIMEEERGEMGVQIMEEERKSGC